VVESAATFFFPGRLDPVLDGGEGDKDAVIAPQVPTGTLVGQTIFTHQSNGQILDTSSVEALGQSQIRHRCGEATSAVGTPMSRKGNEQIDGLPGTRIA
jgi:hypothetical protein